MKRVVGWMIMMVVCCGQVNAQTWSEWFQQKKTQRKYLLEQIARLQVFIEQAKKGYDIVHQGWQVIDDIKKGEFNLHQAFIHSLLAINPSIAAYADVAEVARRQVRLYQAYRQLIKDMHAYSLLTEEEIDLIYTAAYHLIELVQRTLDELVRVTTRQKLAMTDDERLQRINALKQESLQQETDFTRMKTAVQGILMQRRSATIDIEQLRKWHGLK